MNKVKIHVFSGRRDPEWQLTPEQSAYLQNKLANAQPHDQPPAKPSNLGYRGFTISNDDNQSAFVHGGAVHRDGAVYQDNGRDLEKWLLSTVPQGTLSHEVTDHVDSHMNLPHSANVSQIESGSDERLVEHVPPWEPEKWNVAPVLNHNNCYNYSNNRITNTFAQPGNASGRTFSNFTCDDVSMSAKADGLVFGVDPKQPISDGFYLALVIWPGHDFHWYRKDNNGFWSHKPGHTPCINYDSDKKKISDPKTCNRGPYTDFYDFGITTLKVQLE